CELWRERLVRASAKPEWIGRVHECQIGEGTFARAPADKVRWVHHRDHNDITLRDRNEKILRKWLEDEPDNPRVISYLAFELMGSRVESERDGQKLTRWDREKVTESVAYFTRFLEMPGQPPDMRAQQTRRLAQVLILLGRRDDAERVSLPMIVEAPHWADTYLTLAEVAHDRQQWPNVLEFAK